jgi:hypothetical protein
MISGEEETTVGTIFTLPIIDSTVGDDLGVGSGLVRPDLLASSSVEGDDRVVAS